MPTLNIATRRLNESDTYFFETRSKYKDKKSKDKKSKEYYKYKVRCVERVVSLSAYIKMVDIQKGDIIYADDISRSETYKHCKDDSNLLPSIDMVVQNLSKSIASSFTYKLTPHYRYFNVELLDEADLDYDDNQKRLLEGSLEFIKHSDYDRAEELLIELIYLTNEKSYVAFYNLGVITEAKGQYFKAKKYYETAGVLVTEPVKVISESYFRINSLINEQEIVYKQMNR